MNIVLNVGLHSLANPFRDPKKVTAIFRDRSLVKAATLRTTQANEPRVLVGLYKGIPCFNYSGWRFGVVLETGRALE